MANVEVTGLKMNVSASNIADTKRKLEAVKSALTKLKVPDSKVTAITNLAIGVGKFATAVNKIDTTKIDGLSTSLKGLASVEVKKSSITRVNQLGEAFKGLDLKNLNNIDTTKITAFFEALKGLDQVNIKKVTINRVNELGEAFKNVDATALGEQAEKLNNALAPLADTMSKISTSAKELGISANFGKSVAKAADMYDKFSKEASAKGQKEEQPKAPQSFGERFSETVKDASKQLDKIFTSTKIGQAYSALLNLRQAISMVKEEFAKTKAGQFFLAIKASADKAFNAIKEGALKAMAAIKKMVSALGSAALKTTKAIASIGVFNPFKGLADTIGRAYSKLKNLASSLARIAMYRALRTAIKEITKAVKEGLTNLYYWSQATGGDFAPAVDKLATAMLYLKNSIGAAVSPLITYFAHTIDLAVDKVVDLINVINQLFARLTGRATWTRALKYPTQFAESAAGATKKVKDNIQDFDELHILRTDNGGGGASGQDYSKMFEETEFSQGLTEWIENFKTAIKNGRFYEAGNILADEINNVINRVPWGRLGESLANKVNDMFHFAWGVLHNIDFVNIGSSIATFLNHAIETLDVYTIGQVFARKWTALIDFIYGFVTTFNFPALGWRISEFVKGWFDELDGARLGVTISEAIKGVLDAAIAFMSNDDMLEAFVEDIADMINNIDWYGIFCRVLTIGTQILNAIAETINRVVSGNGGSSSTASQYDFSSAPPAIAQRLQAEVSGYTGYHNGRSRFFNSSNQGSFGDLLVTNMTDSVNSADWSALAQAIKNLFKAVWNAVKSTILAEPIADVEEGVAQIVAYATGVYTDEQGNRSFTSDNNGWWTTFFEMPAATVGNLSRRQESLPTFLQSPFATIRNAISDDMHENNRSMFDYTPLGGIINLVKGATRETDRYTKSIGSADRMTKTLSTDTNTFTKAIDSANTGMSDADSNVKSVQSSFESFGSRLSGEVVNKVLSAKSTITSTFTSMKDETTNTLGTLTANVVASMQNTASNVTAPLQGIKNNIVSVFREAGQESVTSISDLSTRMSSALGALVQSSKGQLEGYKGTWQELHGATRGVSNSVIDGSERMANAVTDAFNSLLHNLDGFEIDIPNYKFKSRPKTPLPHITIPKLATGGIVSSPTTALIGEAGREAVLPLENNTEWMNTLADRINGGNEDEVALLREQNDLLRQIAAKNVTISSREVFNAVRDENSDYITRTGRNALAF